MIKASIGALFIGAALVAVTPATASANSSRDVYVSDDTADQVSVFKTSAGGQVLAGPATSGVNGAEALVFSPDGRFFYVSDSDTGAISAYSVGVDGSLAPLAGAGVDAGGSVYGMTITPDGRFLFAVDVVGTLSGYAIGASGALSSYANNTAPLGSTSYGIVAAPDSKSLYIVDLSGNAVLSYTVNPDGSLTEKPGSPTSVGDDPYTLTITPDGRRLYVANYSTSDISGFSVAADGTLTELAGSPYPGAAGPYAGLAVSPGGTRLYESSYDDGNVTTFAIAPDGSLATVGAPIDAGVQTNSVVVSPNGKYVYAAAGSSQEIYAFAVLADGSLAANGVPQPLGAGYSDLQSVAIRPNQPPTARLSTKTVKGVTTLDASASTDADGTVASYAWSFGDGTTATTTTPTVQHTYADGTRQATVTLTDDEGCSSSQVVTGLSVLCNGSAVAAATTTQVAGIAGVQVSAKKTQKQRHALKVVLKAGAAEGVRVDVTGFAKVRGIKGKVALKPVGVSTTASTLVTIKLKAKKKAQGAALVGHKGRVTLTVTLTDADGYVVTRTLRVKLK